MTETLRVTLGGAALLFTALFACHIDDSELPYARLGIVTSELAVASAPTDVRSTCVLLPVLRGSRVETILEVGGTLSIQVAADREQASVKFVNASPAVSPKEYSREELEQGLSEQLELKNALGARYVVVLSSECEADAATH